MAKPPPGAMSSPWGENGEMSQMLKDTSYFKDAQFNTDGKKADAPKPPQVVTPPIPALFQEKVVTANPQLGFDNDTKMELVRLLMSNNINAVNMNETEITFTYKNGLYKVTKVS